jgi:pimeloyl-ACP methyl ester carboxylesterase
MATWARICLALMVIVTLSGCGGVAEPTAAPAAGSAGETEQRTADPPAESEPQELEVEPVEVTFETSDGGTTVYGTLYGQDRVGVILVHRIGIARQDRGRWQPFAEVLAARGYMVLIYDASSYGQTRGPAGGLSARKSLEGAIVFLREQGVEQFVLVGEDIAGAVTLDVAANDQSGDIIGVATLSTAHRSRDGAVEVSEEELATLIMPSLWITCRDSRMETLEALFEATGGPDKELHVYECGTLLRGTDLFKVYGPDLEERLLAFLAHVVSSTAEATRFWYVASDSAS